MSSGSVNSWPKGLAYGSKKAEIQGLIFGRSVNAMLYPVHFRGRGPPRKHSPCSQQWTVPYPKVASPLV